MRVPRRGLVALPVALVALVAGCAQGPEGAEEKAGNLMMLREVKADRWSEAGEP